MARQMLRPTGPAPSLAPYAGCGAVLAPPSPEWSERLPLLVGARASLRELDVTDAPALVSQLNTLEVQRYIAPPPDTVDSFENFILWAQCERARGRYACYGVVPHGMTTPVGVFQLRQIEGGFTTAEWGFALSAAFWGAGYFTDAARLVVDFAVDTVGVRRLEARSAIENGRGNGALRKLGAVQEGILRRAFRKGECVMDAALWTILADEWRQGRAFRRRIVVH